MANPTNKKWYNYFLSVDQGAESKGEGVSSEGDTASGAPRSAAQTVAEIASGVSAEPKFTGPVADPMSFQDIYGAAEPRCEIPDSKFKRTYRERPLLCRIFARR